MWGAALARTISTRDRNVRNQGQVAGVQEAEGHMPNALFGADEGQHFGIRVQLDAESFLVPGSDGAPQLGQPIGLGIAMVGRVLGCPQQPVDDGDRRGDVGVTDGEPAPVLQEVSADVVLQVLKTSHPPELTEPSDKTLPLPTCLPAHMS